MLLRLPSLQRQYVFGVDGRGVGAFVRHPSGELFAVAEKGNEPRVYVYAYPSLEVVRVLPKGTERGYTTMAFSADGKTLATVGMAPDFMLSVWDWENQVGDARARRRAVRCSTPAAAHRLAPPSSSSSRSA